MVMDASIILTVYPDGTPQTETTEALYPPRHKIVLPLNNLNNYFQNCEVAFNHHTKLDCDRYVCKEKKYINKKNFLLKIKLTQNFFRFYQKLFS